MTKVETIYHRYEYLVDFYANSIWNEGNIAMEKEDLRQELRIKLFLAIKSYSKRWKQYRETGRNKPVPIKFFLQTVMANKVKDFIRLINRMPTDSMTGMNFDHGREDFDQIQYSNTDIKIGDESILSMFKGQQKQVMRLLILKDFDKRKVKKIYKKVDKQELENLIVNGLDTIRNYLESQISPVQEYQVTFTEH